MIAKQKKLILALAIVVAALALVLLAVNIFVKNNDNQDELVLLEGEAAGSGNKPRLIEQLSKNDISSIVVSNSNGLFTVINDKDNVFINEYKNYPTNTEMTDSLFSRAESFLVTRVEIEPKDLSVYGLDASSKPAYLQINKTDSTSYKILFGMLSADCLSYYVMCEGRNVVYMIYNTNIDKTVFCTVNDYISPIVAPTLDDISYIDIEYIKIKKNGTDFVAFEKVEDGYKEKTGYTLSHKMTFPTNYLVNITNFEKLLSSFSALYGTKVIGVGYEAEDRLSELDKYGFTDNITEIEYSYSGIPTVLYVTNKTDDGTGYYVYSLYYDTLTVVPIESLPFIEWKLGDYIGQTLFQMSIDYISQIEITGKDASSVFVLDSKDGILSVTSNGISLAGDEKGDAANFRQFYKCILALPWDGYDNPPSSMTNPMLKIKITTVFDEVFEYNFYQISTLRCYFTYNGYGEFYTEKATLDAFIENFKRVIKNETIILA